MTTTLKVLLYIVCAATAVQAQTTDGRTVKLEIKIYELAARQNVAMGYDWLLGNPVAPVDHKSPAGPAPLMRVPSSIPGGTGNTPAGTLSGLLTSPQLKIVVRALEARSDAKILASPQGSTVSGSELRLQRPDGWDLRVTPTVTTNDGKISVAMSLKQGKGDYAGFELSSMTQVRSGETAVFGDRIGIDDIENPDRNLLLLVTPTMQCESQDDVRPE